MAAQSVEDAALLTRPRAFETIVYGGLVVGLLDGLAAVVSSSLRGVGPARVFQYIAAGLLGAAAYSGGITPVLLGILIHFLIAFGAATVYYFASRKFPILIRQALICGMLYGVAVYFFMARVVTPLSLTRKLPLTLLQLVIHVLFVGLPVALIARWSASKD